MKTVLVDGIPVDYSILPESAREIMRRYVEHGLDPGTGYRMILSDDLMAVLAVDEHTLSVLPVILRWIHNYAPAGCHGNSGTVREWMVERQIEARRKAA
jgi:hypothetical protein